MAYLWLFLAGAFLVNAIPHLASGLRGERFPTPFAKPPGRGLSAPRTNMAWGTLNLVAGLALLRAGWSVDPWSALAVATLGWLAMGWYLAGHFGAVRANRED